eukprot:scaffold4919_cov116-Skeletonema_menzelii.AAC.1
MESVLVVSWSVAVVTCNASLGSRLLSSTPAYRTHNNNIWVNVLSSQLQHLIFQGSLLNLGNIKIL